MDRFIQSGNRGNNSGIHFQKSKSTKNLEWIALQFGEHLTTRKLNLNMTNKKKVDFSSSEFARVHNVSPDNISGN